MIFKKIKEYFYRNNLFQMVKIIVQKIKTKKIGKNSKNSNGASWRIKKAGVELSRALISLGRELKNRPL